MNNLSNKCCTPCNGNTPAISESEKELLLSRLKSWTILNSLHLTKSYKFKNFKEALVKVNQIAQIAEKENHHPDIKFGWGYLNIKIQTHSINNLTESDFILAAKIDRIDD